MENCLLEGQRLRFHCDVLCDSRCDFCRLLLGCKLVAERFELFACMWGLLIAEDWFEWPGLRSFGFLLC